MVLTFGGSGFLFGGSGFLFGGSGFLSASLLATALFRNFDFFDESRPRRRVDLVDRARVRSQVDFAVDVGGGADDIMVAAGAPVDGRLVLGQKFFQATTLATDLALLDVVGGGNGVLKFKKN